MNKPKTVVKLPPCRVCDTQASGFHYGVYTCEACKAFFKRSLTRHESYACADEGNCDILNDNRNSCAYCRYQKCIKTGMCKDAIKTGRYSHEQRACNIREMKMLQARNGTASTTKSSNSATSSNHRDFSLSSSNVGLPDNNSDRNKENIETDSELCEDLDVKDLLFGSTETSEDFDVDFLIQNLVVSDIQHSHKPLYDISRVEHYESIIQHLLEIYRACACDSSDCEENLSEKEKECLELVELKKQIYGTLKPIPDEDYVKFYEETALDIDGRRQLLEALLPSWELGIRQLVSFVAGIPGFNDLCMEDQIALIKCARCDVFMIAKHKNFKLEYNIYSHPTEEVLHLEDLKKVKGDIVESVVKIQQKIHNLKLHADETSILAALAVMCTDNCDLRDPSVVEESQQDLLECMHYLFDKYSPKDKLRFARVIDCLIELRTLREESNKCEEQMTQFWWRYVNIPPLLHSVYTT